MPLPSTLDGLANNKGGLSGTILCPVVPQTAIRINVHNGDGARWLVWFKPFALEARLALYVWKEKVLRGCMYVYNRSTNGAIGQ